jgi:fatty acid amide hydrolase
MAESEHEGEPTTVEAIRRAIRGGANAGDVLAACRDRHEASHAALNALVQPRWPDAAREAAGVDGSRPLAGVPVSVKECFAVRGMTTTLGVRARRHAIDEADAEIVVRLRAAGAVVIGKANVPQAMYLHETDNPVWGRTNHPQRPDRNPGGSSGGDAALVAAGVVPLAVGTDLAGSIRQPAHACGVAGIVPRSATLGEGGGFDTLPHLALVRPRAGLLAAHVDNLVAGLEPLAAVAPRAAGPRLAWRIGWWDDCGPLEPSPAVRRAVREAVACLAAAGAVVCELPGGLAAEAAWLHLAILSADGGRPMPEVARLLRLARVPRCVRPLLGALAAFAGRRIEAQGLCATGPRRGAAWQGLVVAREAIAARVRAWAAEFDAVICPVSAVPALRHGTAARLLVAQAPCMLANLLDLPAGAVAVARVRPDEEAGRDSSRDPVAQLAADTDRGSAGLPVGVQVIGLETTPGVGERLVLDIMATLGRAPTSPF